MTPRRSPADDRPGCDALGIPIVGTYMEPDTFTARRENSGGPIMITGPATIMIPPEFFEAIAERAAEIVLERSAKARNGGSEPSPYMTIAEGADFLRCSRQRVDDLLSQKRLTRFKDGARTLVSRAEIESYVEGGA